MERNRPLGRYALPGFHQRLSASDKDWSAVQRTKSPRRYSGICRDGDSRWKILRWHRTRSGAASTNIAGISDQRKTAHAGSWRATTASDYAEIRDQAAKADRENHVHGCTST